MQGRKPPAGLIVAMALAAVVLAAVFASQTGSYVVDGRYEVAVDPAQTFSSAQYARDVEGGLGRAASSDRGLVSSGAYSLLRAVGAPPWAAERIWHGSLILLAAAGAALVSRRIVGGDTIAASIAALVYSVGPVAMGLLRPSPIFMAYAVAPWLIAAALLGPRSRLGPAWSAVFALGVVATAEHELPGLAFVCMSVAVVGVAELWVSDGSMSLRRRIRWWILTGVSCVAVGAYVWTRLALSRDELVARLAITEVPEAPARTSSYAESIRGLGHWLTYFSLGGSSRPHLAPFLTSPWVVAATFVVVFAAMGRVLAVADRRHAMFGLVLVVGVVATVGIHPPDAPTPLGQAIAWGFDEIDGLVALRNTSKAGPAVALATAVLFGSGVAAVARRRDLRTRSAVVICGVACTGIASLPVWTGDIYAESVARTDIPSYWVEAAAFLDDLPETATVFVTPGTGSTPYVWGSVGDDIIAGLTDAHWVRSNGFLTSAARTTDLVDAVEASLTARLRLHQSVAPLLDRLGIDYVLIRNDIDWQRANIASPARFDALRADVGLRPIATFGPGEPPRIEVFAVERSSSVAVHPAGRELVVAGSGEALPVLDSHEGLRSFGVRRYLADLSNAEVVDALGDGAVVVITDTNTVRSRRVAGAKVAESAPLTWQRRPSDASAVFGAATAVTEPTFGDARWVGSDAAAIGAPWNRPEQVFDGAATTVWTAPFLYAERPTLTVLFDEPVRPGAIEVVAGGGVLRPATLVADGVEMGRSEAASSVRFDLVDLDVSELQFVFDGVVDGARGGHSVAEITIEGVDLRPGRRAPIELLERAEADPALGEAVAQAPLAFSFRREAGIGVPPVEFELRRSFRTDRNRTFDVTGWLAGFFADAPFEGCRDYLIIDDAPVPVRATGPSGPATGLTPFESCEPVVLGPGDHELVGSEFVSLETVLVADVDLRAGGVPVSPPPGVGRIVSERNDEIVLEVAVDEASIVSSGAAFQPGWEAWVDGEPRPVTMADTLAAVRVEPGEGTVVFRYGPQRWFRLAVWVSFVSGAAALAVLAWAVWRRYLLGAVARRPPISADRREPDTSPVSAPTIAARVDTSARNGWARWAAAPVAVVAGFAMAGALGALLAAAAYAGVVGGHRRIVAVVCLGLLAAGALLTIVEAPLVVSSNYALDRPWANRSVQHSLVVFAAAVLAIMVRPVSPDEPAAADGQPAVADGETDPARLRDPR